MDLSALAPLAEARVAVVDDFSFEAVTLAERDGFVVWTVRTFLWEDGSIRDVKEQEVNLGACASFSDVARAAAYAQALLTCIAELIPQLSPEQREACMPFDLVAPIDRVKGTTQEEQEKSLRSRRNLGKLVP